MEIMQVAFLGWTAKVVIWCVLFYFGWRNQLITRYKLVFADVVLSALISTVMLALAVTVGRNDFVYALTYVVAQVARLFVSTAILLSIYWLFDKPRWKNDWHLIVVPIVLVCLEFSQFRYSWLPFRLIYCSYAVMVYTGLCALTRRILSKRVELGWNLSMVLLAFTIPGLLHVLKFGSFISGGDPLSLVIWNQFTGVGCWIIVAVGMTEYSPPRLIEMPHIEFHVARERMWGGIKLLWRLLRS